MAPQQNTSPNTDGSSPTIFPSPPYHCYKDSRVSAGAIGGAVAGTFVVASLIGALLTYLFVRRSSASQKPSSSKRHDRQKSPRYSADGAARSTKDQPDSKALVGLQSWEKHLPQSKDDATIASEVQTLFHQIEFHVEGNYRDEKRPASQEAYEQLLSLDPTGSQEHVVRMLESTGSPTVVLKHILCKRIVSHIALAQKPGSSLLPMEYTSIPYLMQWNMEPGRGSRAEVERKPAFWEAFSRWKLLSVYLRPDPANDPAYLEYRNEVMSAALDNILLAFSPWAKKNYNAEQCARNLQGILQRASEVGISIFAQRASFEFNWHPYKLSENGQTIVVTPEFSKVIDDYGKAMSRPEVLVKMVTEPILADVHPGDKGSRS